MMFLRKISVSQTSFLPILFILCICSIVVLLWSHSFLSPSTSENESIIIVRVELQKQKKSHMNNQKLPFQENSKRPSDQNRTIRNHETINNIDNVNNWNIVFLQWTINQNLLSNWNSFTRIKCYEKSANHFLFHLFCVIDNKLQMLLWYFIRTNNWSIYLFWQ